MPMCTDSASRSLKLSPPVIKDSLILVKMIEQFEPDIPLWSMEADSDACALTTAEHLQSTNLQT